MLVLAIDTSSAAVSAAVLDVPVAGAPVVLAQRITVDPRAHGELLAPSIRSSLAEAGATPRDLTAIVAGLGPGPFTGLRVGLMTAAAMSDALGVPAYGVCSLDAIGHGVGQAVGPGVGLTGGLGGGSRLSLLVAADARRREVYWARYVDGVRVDGPNVDQPGVVRAVLDGSADGVHGMAGAGARLYADVLGAELLECDYPPPAALVELAAGRIVAGEPGETLVPLYLRRPDAVAATSFKSVGG